MATEREPDTRLPALGSRGQGWVAGQMLLIFLEGIVSYPSFDALPPASALGWLSLGVGAALFAAGLWAAWRGIGALGSSLSALPAPTDGGELVVDGIYRQVRHPIYAGVIGLALGWAFFVVSPAALVVAAALAVWLDLKARREEAWLLARYPWHAAYRGATARFLPGIY